MLNDILCRRVEAADVQYLRRHLLAVMPLVGRDNRIEIHLVDKRRGLFANLRAAAARLLDDAILLQFRQCLTQRNAADGVLLRQRAF